MQTAANINLVLTDFSSLKRLADFEASYVGFYQLIATHLIEGVHKKEVLGELGDSLVTLAEHAHAFRQMDILENVSQVLLGLPLPRRYEAVGRYYQALCIHKFGRGDVEQAVRLLERLSEAAPPRYRARAMLSMGSMSVRIGDCQSALLLYREADRFASRNALYDPYAIVHAQRNLAVINGEDGNHRGALVLLDNLFPLAHTLRSSQPHVYYDYMNSLAVELCAVGRLEEAKNVSQMVLASQFARAYPEWRETLNEIALKGHRASRSTAAFSQRVSKAGDLVHDRLRPDHSAPVATQTGAKAVNVVCLPVPERGEGLSSRKISPESEPARVLSMQEWTEKMNKRSNDDRHQRRRGPRTDKEKQATLNGTLDLETRELLLGIMDALGDEAVTDDQLRRALIILQGLESDNNQGA
jgi:tetratricopeptide (TPR) repeat protein